MSSSLPNFYSHRDWNAYPLPNNDNNNNNAFAVAVVVVVAVVDGVVVDAVVVARLVSV